MKPSPTFWSMARDRGTVIRSLRVALVVGSLLTIINQGDLMIRGKAPNYWKMLLTYFVPYAVATYSVCSFAATTSRAGDHG